MTDLSQHRDLLWLWTAREVRVRYKQSLLGAAWAILQPLALTLVFTAVFSFLVNIDTGDIPYPLFAYTAMVPWAFFSNSISSGVPSLVNNMNLVSKVYFPREVLPFASIGAAFLDFLIAAAVLLVMLLVYGRVPGLEIIWLVPLLLIQIALTLGVTLFLSAALVFYRDIRFVIPLMLQIWMYASPVIYPTTMVPERFRTLYFLNPMAGVIDGFRRVLLEGLPPDLFATALGAAVSAVALIVGYWFFKRSEPTFADLI